MVVGARQAPTSSGAQPCVQTLLTQWHVQALPVGDKPVGEDWGSWICPHIVGGIPPTVVDAELPMIREGPKYVRIDGLAQ